jgi:DNA-binding CsgD family transcriptional regulator
MPKRAKTLLAQASAFAAQCEQMTTMEALCIGVVDVVEPFGYPYVASGIVTYPGKIETMHFAHWDAAWLDYYRRHDFLQIDPVPIWAVYCGAPCGASRLRRLLPRGHPALKVMEAGDAFGISGGYLAPQRGPDNRFGVVAFIGRRDPESAEDRFALRALAGVVFDKAEALLGRGPPERLPSPPPPLTERERVCLKHLVDGRSTAFIARAMAVAEATVRFHTRNLRVKTGAANRAQLTAMAISQALVAPEPGRRG